MSVINTNLASLNSQRALKTSQADLNTSLQRLSSGLRINSAKDDAAGLAIATKMTTQIRGMDQGIRNANDGVSLAQTADGALATMSDAMQRMRELAIQAKNGTNTDDDRAMLNKEFQELTKEITRIGTDTEFNGSAVLSGKAVDIQVGSGASHTITIPAAALTKPTAIAGDLTSAANAATALTDIDAAMKEVTGARAEIGASQNRFGYAISNLQTSVENQSAAKSRIMDTDFAAETAKMSRSQILQQAGTAMLAQANQSPNGVMALLRG